MQSEQVCLATRELHAMLNVNDSENAVIVMLRLWNVREKASCFPFRVQDRQ